MMIPSPQQLATFRKEREIRRARVRKILIDRGLEHVAESLGSKKVIYILAAIVSYSYNAMFSYKVTLVL